jgi:thymidylate synthase (FAD)
MKVTLISRTSGDNGETPEQLIAKIARVSSSKTEDEKIEAPERLISYLIKNKHWSPFEHATLTFEIETSRAIGTQYIRHRSFTFQELSQRYANVEDVLGEDNFFQPIELRKSGTTNRQSSIEDADFNPHIEIYDALHLNHVNDKSSELIKDHLQNSLNLYKALIEAEVATEVARFVLPLCTTTKIHMTGTIRSWIHFLDLRDDSHAQKEGRVIAQHIKNIFIDEFPIISNALGYEKYNNS